MWIEIENLTEWEAFIESHLVRGVWIEIHLHDNIVEEYFVAPRERCVD